MAEIFNKEEETRLFGIIDDYKTIYEKANFLAVQMEKMEAEMSELLHKMEDLKEEESSIYINASERSGNDLEEVKKIAADIVLENQQKNTFTTVENIEN